MSRGLLQGGLDDRKTDWVGNRFLKARKTFSSTLTICRHAAGLLALLNFALSSARDCLQYCAERCHTRNDYYALYLTELP